MAAAFSAGALPPVFDPTRARRTLSELERQGGGAPNGVLRALVEAAAGNSPYLARIMLREPGFVATLVADGPDAVLAAQETDALAAAEDPDMTAAMRRLRIAKRRMALTVAFADISGVYDLAAVTGALTRFADAAVKGALRFLLREASRRAGMTDTNAAMLESSTGLIVLAMGKHGAFELNYSSDIDLIVFYDEERFPFATRGDKGSAAVGLVKDLLKLIAEPTADGYVFRVDLRLRPDAGATQVAIGAESAELYYESMGQNWERAAMIKARACAGDPVAAASFLKALTPFVWRKNLDFAAIEDIHSIKRQIHAHGGHGKIAVLGHDIKLGRGGIREIEFFAQTQQLILGGRDPTLRDPTTLGALAALKKRSLITEAAERDMAEAYVFLRMVEHRLQMVDDQQTHTLPKVMDGLDQIARFAGYTDTGAFEEALVGHLRRVVSNYAHLFEREPPLATRTGSLVFTGVEDDPETIATLRAMGFRAPHDIAPIIRGWHHGRVRATRSARARELLTKLMPALLEALAATADPHSAFVHLDRFLTGLPSGVQVFSLLLANPGLLRLIAEIVGSAPRLAEYLGRNPGVLDALIDAEFLSSMPTMDELRVRFAAERERFSGFEGALDAARRFAREEAFRIGVQVIEGVADAQRAGPAYAAVAETVIAGLQPAVEAEMQAAHGRIAGGVFAVVALGKLGGHEMTAGSDLDLVFVYDYTPGAELSDGPKPLAPGPYFARAAQRFIAALTALTAEGRLYEVDMRLRPSGNQGPVAVHRESFVAYHRTKAWTWERLALTRARVLSGPEPLRTHVAAAIREALMQPVPCAQVLADARAMRDKLAAQFPSRDRWDIKFAAGGLVDIEFIAQTLQLCHAHDADVLDQNTVGALTKLASAGVLAPTDADALIAAAALEHALTQILRIALDGPFRPAAATAGLKALLVRAARVSDFAAVESALAREQDIVRMLFERLIPPV